MLSLGIPQGRISSERSQKARALREFIRSIRSVTAKIYQLSAGDLLECLQKARLNENSVPKRCLATIAISREAWESIACGRTCNKMAASHLVRAARCYAAAATHCAASSNFTRAFQYFRKASRYCRTAAEMQGAEMQEGNDALLHAADEYAYRAATLRQHLAKRRLLRRKLRRAMRIWPS